MVENRFPALRVPMGGHQAIWLMIAPQARRFWAVDGAAIYGDAILRRDVKSWAFQHHAIDADPTFLNPALRFPTRA